MMLNATTNDENTQSLPPTLEQPCRCFSISELSSATDDFDEKWLIGQGGFGKVYKGKIIDGTTNTYAIKLLHFMSHQGAHEFWVEVEMLTRLRHCNIVPLIGYCNEGKYMALVYEYIQNGTLFDHLHKKGTRLTWSQWLKICIGAARGLDYLHTGTGTQQGVIHRDVKSSNILLDQNFAAKIADFGLARVGPINQTRTYVSTTVKGTFGYMDPNYFYTGRLTRKSDVYAFGVVLLEVLSRRPAVDENLDEGLAIWAQGLIKQGKLSQIVSSSLRDHISKSSLKEFSRIVVQCLSSHPNQRPTMSEVVSSLDRALSLQERKASSTQGRKSIGNLFSLLSLKGFFELKSSGAADSEEINVSVAFPAFVTEVESVAFPAFVTEVETDRQEPLEGQDKNHSKSYQVNTSYIIPLVDTSLSTSTSTGFTEINESIRISNRDDGYSDSSSRNVGGVSGVELGNKYTPDHVSSKEWENNGSDARIPADNSGNYYASDQVGTEWIEQYVAGVYVTLLSLPDGTRELKRIRFSKRRFDVQQTEKWWSENRNKVYERYNVTPLVLKEAP